MTTVQGSKSSLNANETGNTYTQTVVAAGDTLTIKSGSDTNIIGAQAQGGTVKMTVDGNLNITSLQDTEKYSERSSSSGGSIGLGKGMGSSVSAGKGKIDSTYASVTGQSGIYAGQGGFDINVGGNTDLKGAVIASDATPDKNKLSTGTLTYSDIQNKAEYKASSSGFSLSTQLIKDGKPNLDDNNAYKAGTDGSASGVTRSAVAPGTIEVKKPEGQTQDVNSLSRDTKNANEKLTPIFDKEKVKEELEFQKVLQEVVTKELNKEPKPKEIAPAAVAALGAAVWLAAGVYQVTTANGDKKIVDANGQLLATWSNEVNGYIDHLGKRVDDLKSWASKWFTPPATDTSTPSGQTVYDNPGQQQGPTTTTTPSSDPNTGTSTTIPLTPQNNNPVINNQWYNPDGTINLPPNGGAIPGTEVSTSLGIGQTLGRYGGTENSKYAVPPGTPAESVSPPPWTDRTQYKEYEVIKPIPNVTQSSATPWGGDTGLGTQYELPMTIEQLLREGYIKPKE